MWPVTLSGRLPIDALVSLYLTNKLIGHKPLLERELKSEAPFHLTSKDMRQYWVLASLSVRYSHLEGELSMHYSPVRHSTRLPKKPFSCDLHA